MTISSLDEVLAAGNLLTVDKAQEILATSEPLESVYLDDTVSFRAGDCWELDIPVKGPDELVDAYVSVGSKEYQLTLEAALAAATQVGLTGAYVRKSPSELIYPQLNYWYARPEFKSEIKFLVDGNDSVRTLTRSTVDSFSNLRLLDSTLSAIHDKFGDEPVYVDSKINHSLSATYLRLVVPAKSYAVTGTEVENDEWSLGLQLKNSIIGKSPQTSVDGYLFRYWCSNGAIDTRHSMGGWSRRSSNDSQEVYSWIRKSADNILAEAESAFVGVQHLAETPAEGVSNIFRDLFERYAIPVKLQEPILDAALEHKPTMYEVMQAITSAANIPNQRAETVEKLMLVGGQLATIQADRCDGCHRII